MKILPCIAMLCAAVSCTPQVEAVPVESVIQSSVSSAYSVTGDSVYTDGDKVGTVFVDSEGSGNVAVVWDEAPLGLTPLNIPPMKQDGSYDCWATCGAMIVNYRLNLGLYPVDFVYASYGISDGPGDLSGNWQLFKTGMNYYDLSVSQGAPMTFAQVQAQIDRGNPVMFVGQTPRGNYHDVLITHASVTIQGQEIYGYNDPWTGKYTITIAGHNYPDMFYMAGEWVTWSLTRWGFYKMHTS